MNRIENGNGCAMLLGVNSLRFWMAGLSKTITIQKVQNINLRDSDGFKFSSVQTEALSKYFYRRLYCQNGDSWTVLLGFNF